MPGLRGILRKNGGAVKRQKRILQNFQKTSKGIDSAGRAGRIGQVYIILGFPPPDRPTVCASTSYARQRAIFVQLRGSVVDVSLKFFERDFRQRLVELLKR